LLVIVLLLSTCFSFAPVVPNVSASRALVDMIYTVIMIRFVRNRVRSIQDIDRLNRKEKLSRKLKAFLP
jgi:hypothetical protein